MTEIALKDQVAFTWRMKSITIDRKSEVYHRFTNGIIDLP